jgi:hypothetical protein
MILHSVPSCVINRPVLRICLLDLLYIFQVEGDLILTTASTLYDTSTIPLWQLQSSSAGAYMHINDDGVIGLYAAMSDGMTATDTLTAAAWQLTVPLITADTMHNSSSQVLLNSFQAVDAIERALQETPVVSTLRSGKSQSAPYSWTSPKGTYALEVRKQTKMYCCIIQILVRYCGS